jgi:hypothetical protein
MHEGRVGISRGGGRIYFRWEDVFAPKWSLMRKKFRHIRVYLFIDIYTHTVYTVCICICTYIFIYIFIYFDSV